MPLRQLIELITPISCSRCGQDGSWLCSACQAQIPSPAEVCPGCGRRSRGNEMCSACQPQSHLEAVIVAAPYEAVKELVLALKFDGGRGAADPLAEMVYRVLPDALAITGVTAVPVVPSRRRERGYNQSELLARQVADRLEVPYQAVLRRRGRVHQLGAGRSDRLQQVNGAFEAIRPLAGTWLLIDDVVTTGATLEACAGVMKGAGATAVTAAVVAGQRA